MARFYYREAAVVPATADDCVEAARRTLVEMGSRPVVNGLRVHGEVGFWLRTRFVGAFFCPESWLPIEVTMQVLEGGSGRQIVVDVAERFGFGSMIGMEAKYRRHCQQTATWIRDRVTAILASAPPGAAQG